MVDLKFNSQEELFGRITLNDRSDQSTKKVLRIVPSRGVQGGHFYTGFGDNLKPRLTTYIKSKQSQGQIDEVAVQAEVNGILEQFQSCFPTKRMFAKGTSNVCQLTLLKDQILTSSLTATSQEVQK